MLYILLLVVIVVVAYFGVRNSQRGRGDRSMKVPDPMERDYQAELRAAIDQDVAKPSYDPDSPRAKYGELERRPVGATLPDPTDWRSVIDTPLNQSKAQLYGEAVFHELKEIVSVLGERFESEGGKWQYVYEDALYKVWYDSDRPGLEDLQVLGEEGTVLFVRQQGSVVVTTQMAPGPWVDHFLGHKAKSR